MTLEVLEKLLEEAKELYEKRSEGDRRRREGSRLVEKRIGRGSNWGESFARLVFFRCVWPM